MNRRRSIDKINSKYRGSAVTSPQPLGVIGSTVAPVTALRRSIVAPTVLYGGAPSAVRHTGLPTTGHIVSSGLPVAVNQTYVTSGLPSATNAVIRRSRIETYPSVGPSYLAPTTAVVTQTPQVAGRTTVFF